MLLTLVERTLMGIRNFIQLFGNVQRWLKSSMINLRDGEVLLKNYIVLMRQDEIKFSVQILFGGACNECPEDWPRG